MNERIKELAEQAGITTNLDTDYYEKDTNKWVDYFSEKFAELIFQEMLGMLEQYTQDSFPEDEPDDFDKGYLAGLYTAQKAVKKHFGVEE